MENMIEFLPFLIPIVLIQFGLMVGALVHIFRHQTYRVGNRAVWVLVCVLINIIGPVLYFAVGRGDE